METEEYNEGQVIIVARWVAVHETVDGPKLRRLCKIMGCPKAEALGILCYLWLWGQENATADGEILDADKEEIAAYLAYMDKGSKIDFDRFVDALVECKWLDVIDGKLYIHDWSTWQGDWYKAMARRAKDVERKAKEAAREKSKAAAGQSQELGKGELPEVAEASENPAGLIPPEDGGDGENPPSPPAEGSKRTQRTYPIPFEEFWKAYPRHIDKGYAYLKYQARRKDGYSDEELIQAARNYAAVCKRKGTDKEYIKHPKTFLSETCPFRDYLPAEEDAASVQTGNPFQQYGGKA